MQRPYSVYRMPHRLKLLITITILLSNLQFHLIQVCKVQYVLPVVYVSLTRCAWNISLILCLNNNNPYVGRGIRFHQSLMLWRMNMGIFQQNIPLVASTLLVKNWIYQTFKVWRLERKSLWSRREPS